MHDSPSFHHFCPRVDVKSVSTIEELTKSDGKKLGFISSWKIDAQSLDKLRTTIGELSTVCDTVHVNLGEPGFMWNYPHEDTTGWDVRIYTTIDYINSFKQPNLVFHANLVPMKPVNHPLHYLNDMFFYGPRLYEENKLCKSLLAKLEYNSKKKYHWEAMCGWHDYLYHRLQSHAVANSTLSTCHVLGIKFFSDEVIEFNKTGAETYFKDMANINVRASDLIDPGIYNQSHYSCVFETCAHPDFAMFSEKEAKPIMAGRPFVMFGSPNHLKAFRSLGFKSFSPVIDESYDTILDRDKRFNAVLDAMQKLTERDPAEVLRELAPVLKHNRDHFLNNNWNSEFLTAWFDSREDTGEL